MWGELGDLKVGDWVQQEGPRGSGREGVALGCFGACLSVNKQEVQDVGGGAVPMSRWQWEALLSSLGPGLCF